MLLLSIELQLNFYRIARLAGWEPSSVNLVSIISHVIGFILLVTFLFFINRRWLHYRKSRYLTTFLWFPYLILFIFLFANIFPITYRGDAPSLASGLIIFAQLIIYPILLACTLFLGKAISSEPEGILSKG